MTKREQLRMITAALCASTVFSAADPDAIIKKAAKLAEKIYNEFPEPKLHVDKDRIL